MSKRELNTKENIKTVTSNQFLTAPTGKPVGF